MFSLFHSLSKLICKLAVLISSLYVAQAQAINVEYLERKCNVGDSTACTNLAYHYHETYLATSQISLFDNALRYSKIACDNDASTCMLYGQILEEANLMGFDVSPFLNQSTLDDEIIHIYNKALDSKGLTSEEEGLVLSKIAQAYERAGNPTQATLFYVTSCESNFLEGCILAAHNFYTGYGVEVDTNLGKIYAQKACNFGLQEGCKIVKQGKKYFGY